MMNQIFFFLFIFNCSANAAVSVEAIDASYDEYEGVHLVEALLEDGKTGKAEQVLFSLPAKDQIGAYFSKLKGDLFFQQGLFTKARDQYRDALANDQSQKVLNREAVYVLLAESHHQMSEPGLCREAFQKAGSALSDRQLILKATCEHQTGHWNEAWKSLHSGTSSLQIQRQKIHFLLKWGLYHEAETLAGRIMAGNSLAANESLAIADLFLSENRSNETFRLLELARLQFPGHSEVLLAWAQLSYQKNWPLQTAEAFSQASVQKAQYYFQTAELFRQIGKFTASRYYSQFIEDPSKRLKTRVALAVDRKEYTQVAALEGLLSRSELSQDDDVNYAMSFSLFRNGQYDKALNYLDRVQRPEMLTRALALRKVVEEKANWQTQ